MELKWKERKLGGWTSETGQLQFLVIELRGQWVAFSKLPGSDEFWTKEAKSLEEAKQFCIETAEKVLHS